MTIVCFSEPLIDVTTVDPTPRHHSWAPAGALQQSLIENGNSCFPFEFEGIMHLFFSAPITDVTGGDPIPLHHSLSPAGTLRESVMENGKSAVLFYLE